jgi:hypothetical protein
MLRSKVSIFLACMLVIILAGSLHAVEPPPNEVLISVPEGAKLKYARVSFSHDPHMQFDCMACHHQWDGNSPQDKCSTSGCHDLANPSSPEEMWASAYFRQAFHGEERSCNACHQRLRKAGRPTGPTGCKGCHT